jgi:hypothetical protein
MPRRFLTAEKVHFFLRLRLILTCKNASISFEFSDVSRSDPGCEMLYKTCIGQDMGCADGKIDAPCEDPINIT